MNWLRLIRWKNLLIVFLTQLLVWYCLIYGSKGSILTSFAQAGGYANLQRYPVSFYFFYEFQNFLLISISTLLIAAAGYVINDYFDLKIDIINRPNKVVLEKKIPLRVAIIAHTILNVVALLLAAVVAHRAHHYEWLLIQVGCTILLWFYSTHFKKQFVTGNVVVAVLTAFTIVVLVLFNPMMHEFPLSIPTAPAFHGLGEYYINPLWVCSVYCFFAFMTTWMREIVKDMEDYKGDAAEGCMTMPIKKGLEYSIRFTQALGIATILALITVAYYLFKIRYIFLGVYTVALLVIPLAIWSISLQRKTTSAHYNLVSRRMKIIMIMGICSLILYYFQNSITD